MGYLFCLVAIPIIMAFFAMLIPLGILHLLAPGLDPVTLSWIVFPSAAVIFLGFAWLVFVRPRRDCIVLHERGLRIRLGWKRLAVPFDQLAELRSGREGGSVEQALTAVLRVFRPGTMSHLESLNETALTLTLTNGKVHVFKTFFLAFDPEDAADFFERVAQVCSRPAEAPSQQTEGKDAPK
ncbi:MAG: hypothetical protein L0Z62_02070 [Gemmataceae bacterium]|nr:hypothetical protein [Gemmataceae bacterium]